MGTAIPVLVPFLVLLLIGDKHLTNCDHHEHQLYKDLLVNYSPLERPVFNNSLPVKVTLGLILQQIVDLDEKNQIIEVNAWLKYTWKDYKLQWEPLEYGGVTDVRFPVGKIWRPDVLLYNSADANFDSTYPSNLVVYSSGEVNWIPPGYYNYLLSAFFALSACISSILAIPCCIFRFGSWTYHGYALDLQPESHDGMDVSEYLTNGEWLLLSTPVKRSEKFYDCCDEPYPDLKFYLNIRRRTLYYGFNLIIPSLLISLMTVLGFTLPPDAGEKITLEITILLSVCFFLSIVADMSPPTSEAVPLIGTFFSCCMLVVSASVVFTVVVLNLHYRTPDTHHMSPFVRLIIIIIIASILLIQEGKMLHSKQKVAWKGSPECELSQTRPTKGEHGDLHESESLIRNVRNQEGQGGNVSHNASSDNYSTHASNHTHEHHLGATLSDKPPGMTIIQGMASTTILAKQVALHRKESQDLEKKVKTCLKPLLERPGSMDTGLHAMILMMQRIHMELKFMTKRMEKEDEDECDENDWKFAAMVVDRLCLVVFSLFIVASTCGIMFSAPNLTA